VLLKARRLFKGGELLTAAISQAGDGGIECEYARRVLREVLGEWNLLEWSDRRRRTNHEVFRAIDRAVAVCSKAKHAGGWHVSAKRRKEVAPDDGRAA
jgi:hypothetical protein